MNRPKFHVKKGDKVHIITGNHKGSVGKILQVLRKKERVFVEGVRMIKKHVRKSKDHPNGGIVELEGPIHISNVKRFEPIEDTKKITKTTPKKAK